MSFPVSGIESERLILVPPDVRYSEEIFKEFTSRVTEYMFPKPSRNLDEARGVVKTFVEQFENQSDLVLVVLEKTRNEFLGCVGFHGIANEVPELGIWIKEGAFGKRYGFEAVETLVDWAAAQNRWRLAQYPVDRRNIPSRKIAEALGGTVVKEYRKVNQIGKELDEVEYEIPIADRLAKHQGGHRLRPLS